MAAVRQISRCCRVFDVLFMALWLTASGCKSVYERTQPLLPPDPCAQLKMRIEDARRWERVTAEAGGQLRDHLKRSPSAEAIQTDFDRLEMSAFELQRRTNEARDAAGSCEQQKQFSDDLDGLDASAKAWLDYVHTYRQAEAVAQTRQLDNLLRVSAPSAKEQTSSGQE